MRLWWEGGSGVDWNILHCLSEHCSHLGVTIASVVDLLRDRRRDSAGLCVNSGDTRVVLFQTGSS